MFCEEWNDFSEFLRDMGERPKGTTLDRIDNSGDYCAENCRWASLETQGRNKRTNRIVEYAGEKMPLVELSERTGTPYGRLFDRIFRSGWAVERAVTEPSRGY